ncbi:MAG: RdgB/HAM1 family non-canonical purine NTP pyrophosphatase [Candidatus Contendobacter sp.]|nr:RdgB/HAM1 family non-canonical purine NTP pyrophosphatase [Candidatus Contendobacter sp.]MDS4059215.1 RdgB/HAM1 family non-canonical purine NTP pyrophosphatase [Candidatus Contendobacter sp.]
MRKIVLATGNAGKLREFAAVLAELELEIMPQSAFNVPEADETGLTFIENALLKARNAALRTGLPALADDSGLVVDALGGAPGIRSARYAGFNADDRANIGKLLVELREVPLERRTARFVCVLAWLRHPADPTPLICQGSWEGVILAEPRGANGFGYDPVFFVPGVQRTAAEMDPADKNRLSHRGRALTLLGERLRDAAAW